MMNVWLVRAKNSKELIGIFVAQTHKELFYLVDAECDPFQCECKSIGEGGITFDYKESRFLPDEYPVKNVHIFETWFHDICDHKGKKRWQSIMYSPYAKGAA